MVDEIDTLCNGVIISVRETRSRYTSQVRQHASKRARGKREWLKAEERKELLASSLTTEMKCELIALFTVDSRITCI